MRKAFQMPKKIKITGRSSSITNAFINSIIPVIEPSEEELIKVFEILQLDHKDLRCAYCGDKSTEWDHLRPIVKNQRPTGYISEIKNLVPSCGKCNQSKGNKYWKTWITSDAPRSPKSRNVDKLDEKIRRLNVYEEWGQVEPINFENFLDGSTWDEHWNNWEEVLKKLNESQLLANNIYAEICKRCSEGGKNIQCNTL